MSNINWARDNGNGYFLCSLENTLGHFQTETFKNNQEIFLVKARIHHSLNSQSFPTTGQIKDGFGTNRVSGRKTKKHLKNPQGKYCYI